MLKPIDGANKWTEQVLGVAFPEKLNSVPYPNLEETRDFIV